MLDINIRATTRKITQGNLATYRARIIIIDPGLEGIQPPFKRQFYYGPHYINRADALEHAEREVSRILDTGSL